jgi:20S proteasome alpha/beta subunit
MTCIVGVKYKDMIYMGGDSAGVSGHNVRLRADEKIFSSGPMLFGFTTSFRMGQLLRYSLKIPTQEKNQNDYEFMCTTFINSVRTSLKEGGYVEIKNNQESGGTFIVGYNSKLYTVYDDFQVSETIDDFTSIGCGESYALGSLRMTSKLEPKKRIKLALETASYFSGGVYPPFKYIVGRY